jgi:hypothetical protein
VSGKAGKKKARTLLLEFVGLLEIALEHRKEGFIVLHRHARVLHDQDTRLVHALRHLIENGKLKFNRDPMFGY